MNTSSKYILFIISFIFLLQSCNRQIEKEITCALSFDPNNSSVNKPFFRDSILITYYKKDSILIKNYFNGTYYQNIYFNCGNKFFEKRYVSDLPSQIFEIDTVLTFAKEDTFLIYKSKRDDFIVTLIDLSLIDGRYIIQKDGNNYKTIKQSLIDTTYKEIFFYDKNYRIYKFVNTWKNNNSVYILSSSR
ncbi:MAG: hypothetical protein LBG96_14885 [Tannerella sp.]|jgi:hypothetical protein|nr:hypothetical protein [Tannerella sp.]